jgi:hypothetical protein
VAEIKEKESKPDSEYDSENNGRRQIIETDPTSTVVIAMIQLEEPKDLEE